MISKTIKLFVTSLVASASLLSGQVLAAGNASLSLSLSSSSVINGSSVNVSIYENGTDVNVVTAKLTYDSSRLSCDASSISSISSFASPIVASCGGGSVTISRSTSPGAPALTGSQLISSVSFKAIGTGSASISTVVGSQIASSGSNIWNGSIASSAVTIVAPAVTPTPATPTSPKTATSTTITQTKTATPASNNTTLASNATAATPGSSSAVLSANKEEDTASKAATTKNVASGAKSSDADKSSISNKKYLFIITGAIALILMALYAVRKHKGTTETPAVVVASAAAKKKTISSGKTKKKNSNKAKTSKRV